MLHDEAELHKMPVDFVTRFCSTLISGISSFLVISVQFPTLTESERVIEDAAKNHRVAIEHCQLSFTDVWSP